LRTGQYYSDVCWFKS